MAQEISERLHIITLVVNRGRDIPMIRSRSKVLAREAGFTRICVVQIATSASDMARVLLRSFGGGRVGLWLVRMAESHLGAGIELLFEGKAGCALQDFRGLCEIPPYAGLRRVLDEVSIETNPSEGWPARIRCLKWGLSTPWEDLQEREGLIRKELFADTEESYLENLRAKHEEVLRLLKEKADKNHELDRMNAQLLQLAEDLEAIAQERTVFEMTLKVADRIRNPVMVIGGLIKGIRKDLKESDDVWGEKFDAVIEQVKKIEGVVREFDTVAREETRFFSHHELGGVVSEILGAWIPTLEKKRIRPDIDIHEEPVLARINPRTFKVALLHVLRNATYASPQGGAIRIAVAKGKKGPEVSVSDQGAGIPPEVKERLFKASVTTKPAGTGLGLILVKQIMEEHQGEIEIESDPDRGTRVTLLFPVRWKEAGRPSAGSPARQA